MGSVSPTATAPHGCTLPHGPCCLRVVVSSLSLSLSRLFERCSQLHGILHSGCTIELKILFPTVQQNCFLTLCLTYKRQKTKAQGRQVKILYFWLDGS